MFICVCICMCFQVFIRLRAVPISRSNVFELLKVKNWGLLFNIYLLHILPWGAEANHGYWSVVYADR